MVTDKIYYVMASNIISTIKFHSLKYLLNSICLQKKIKRMIFDDGFIIK